MLQIDLDLENPHLCSTKATKPNRHIATPMQPFDPCLCDPWCDLCLIIPMIAKATNNALNKSQYISSSNSPHYNEGTTTTGRAYSFLIIPVINKATNNVSNKK